MLEIHLMNDREVVVRKTVEAGTMHLYGSGIDPKEQDRLNRASSIPRREWVMGHVGSPSPAPLKANTLYSPRHICERAVSWA